jgi:hypothetical protein
VPAWARLGFRFARAAPLAFGVGVGPRLHRRQEDDALLPLGRADQATAGQQIQEGPQLRLVAEGRFVGHIVQVQGLPSAFTPIPGSAPWFATKHQIRNR